MIPSYRIELIRDIDSDGHFLPRGTPGLHVGSRAHLDWMYIVENGSKCNIPCIVEGIEEGKDYRVIEEEDGTYKGFSAGFKRTIPR